MENHRKPTVMDSFVPYQLWKARKNRNNPNILLWSPDNSLQYTPDQVQAFFPYQKMRRELDNVLIRRIMPEYTTQEWLAILGLVGYTKDSKSFFTRLIGDSGKTVGFIRPFDQIQRIEDDISILLDFNSDEGHLLTEGQVAFTRTLATIGIRQCLRSEPICPGTQRILTSLTDVQPELVYEIRAEQIADFNKHQAQPNVRRLDRVLLGK